MKRCAKARGVVDLFIAALRGDAAWRRCVATLRGDAAWLRCGDACGDTYGDTCPVARAP